MIDGRLVGSGAGCRQRVNFSSNSFVQLLKVCGELQYVEFATGLMKDV